MTAAVRRVDFRAARHKKRAKDFLSDACDVIADIDYKIVGYALIVWDDTGNASSVSQDGGPVGIGSLPSYVSMKLNNAIEKSRY